MELLQSCPTLSVSYEAFDGDKLSLTLLLTGTFSCVDEYALHVVLFLNFDVVEVV